MATERLNVTIVTDYKVGYYNCDVHWMTNNCNSNCPPRKSFAKDIECKKFAVYYPTDANWKERAQLVFDQIVERAGKELVVLGNYQFILLPQVKSDDWGVVHEKERFARKFIKLLLWEEGKTPIEDRWIKLSRSNEPLKVEKVYGQVSVGL